VRCLKCSKRMSQVATLRGVAIDSCKTCGIAIKRKRGRVSVSTREWVLELSEGFLLIGEKDHV